ncbi:MAG: hypothetical protein EOO24_15000, partial [Comamonadaceae bacterium]
MEDARARRRPRLWGAAASEGQAMAGLRKWFTTGPVSHELNLSASYFYMDFTNGGARYAASPS